MKMAKPAHPGEIIAETLEETNTGVRQFAKAMHISPATASRIIAGKTAVTPEMAIKLAAVIGSTPETWLKIQASYSLAIARENVDTSALNRLVLA